MKSQSLLIPWFCLVATAGSSVAFANDGLDAYRQGRYSQAAELLPKDTGKDPIVNYYMGRMRLYGYGELKNNAEAMHYFQRAADKGYLPAQHIMALYSLLKENDPEQALFWFKKAAADVNDTQAQMYCAAAYLYGVGAKKNIDMAKRYYIAAARNGNAIAQYTIAEDFLNTRHPENRKLGLIWLNKAVAQNNPAAQVKLAELYANGNLVPADPAKAKELLGMAIAKGYLPAEYQMGMLLQQQNDLPQAKDWFSKAALAHYSPAEIALARLYSQEKGPFFNAHLGFLTMLNAAQNGSTEAQFALAMMYKNGQGVDKDENLAKEWQTKAVQSQKEDPGTALVKAAQWLSMGKGDKFASSGYRLTGIFSDWQNPEAVKDHHYNQAPQMETVTRDVLFKPKFAMTRPNDIAVSEYYDALARALSSAKQGGLEFPRYAIDKQLTSEQRNKVLSASSQTEISDQALFKFLQGRAVLGDNTAQFTLGQMYQDGIGCSQDIGLAIKNYELASAQQDLRAEYNLGLLYLEGHGIPADYQKASALLRDAAFKGDVYAQYTLGRIDELGYRNAVGDFAIQPDADQAMAMYDLAAANDYGLAQYRLAEMLVREKKVELSLASKQHRNQMLKQLYQGAKNAGVAEADVPLAFFDAMDNDKAKQAHAFEVAKKEADEGNAQAALLLGLMYDRGIGVEADQSEAIHWYQQGPQNPVTSFILGTYTSQGIGTSKDMVKGKVLLQQAADSGFSYANLNLAVMKNELGEPFLPDLDKALTLGNSTAGLLLADYYLSLANNDEQMQEARNIYQDLAGKGDKEGQLKLGYMFDKGLGGSVDAMNAEKWYGLAAEQGQPVAQYLLGNLYQLGRTGPQPDYALAKKWYSSAQSNYAPAAVALGFINETVDDNYQEALKAYQMAADKHSVIGQFDLGLIYEKGKGYPVDAAKAQQLYQEAAQQGHAQSMVQMAGLYLNGFDGQRDADKAYELYKKAGDLGDKNALYQLGLLSETGVGTKLDFSEAIKYYLEAANKGNANAKLALGRIYQFGLGVPKDNLKAEKYYKELAANGNPYAQYQLATFYYEGVNGKRMPAEGKQLLQQAKENGSEQAMKVLQWLDAQSQERTSFIEPALIHSSSVASEQPAELMYLDALNEWNRGDVLSSRTIFDQLMVQFPDYDPAKRAYQELNLQFTAPAIFG